MGKTFASAEVVETKEGRQYHIGCKPGDVAPFILLCGDPARASKVASHFTKTRPALTHREYVTITGEFRDIPVTVMATGMGPDNTEIAFVELSRIVESPTMIRIGSCGALRKEIQLAELVISTGAVRFENTSTAYVVEGYPAIAHHEATLALIEAAARLQHPHHVGLTATVPGFYGFQGRDVPGFPSRYAELPATLDRMNVANIEMEMSSLFTLGAFRGIRVGGVCAAYADRHANKFIDEALMKEAEARCIETGLEAIVVLDAMDRIRGKGKHWLPSMGIKF